jgi:hypothetical protein
LIGLFKRPGKAGDAARAYVGQHFIQVDQEICQLSETTLPEDAEEWYSMSSALPPTASIA